MRRVVLAALILAFFTINAGTLTAMGSFQPKGPTVFVDPGDIVMYKGQTITIRVRVFNLTAVSVPDPAFPLYKIPLGNLYGFDITLHWDTTYFSYVLYSEVPYLPVEDWPDGVLYEPVSEIANLVDQIQGTYNLAFSSISDPDRYPYPYIPPAFNKPDDNSTIFVIGFTAIKVGTTKFGLPIAEVNLADNSSRPIGRSQAGAPIYLYALNATVRVKIPGDVDGNGIVATADLGPFSLSYGSVRLGPRWNPMCNFNNDNKVDISDLYLLGKNFGKSES